MKNKLPNWLFLTLLVIVISACLGVKEEDTLHIKMHNFTNTVYFFTTNFDSTNCAVYSACDCCSDHLVFLDSNEFILINYCLSDQEYFPGKYVVLDGTMQLNFDSTYVSKEYNWDYELDTTGTVKNEYYIKKLTHKPQPARFDIFYCKDRPCFKVESTDEEYFGVLDTLQVQEMIAGMKKDNIWQKL